MEELAARTVLPDLPVQLFIILPRIPYLSATIIAIRDLPEFFRICEPVIQSPQILFAQRMYPAVFPDQLHTKLPVPVIFLQDLAQKFTHVRNLRSHMGMFHLDQGRSVGSEQDIVLIHISVADTSGIAAILFRILPRFFWSMKPGWIVWTSWWAIYR